MVEILSISVIELFRQARGLVAEHQIGILRECCPIEASLCLGTQKGQFAGLLGRKERVPVGMYGEQDMFPIVEAAPLDVTTVERECQRLDEMEPRSQSHTNPAHCAGILRDLRCNKNYVYTRFWHTERYRIQVAVGKK